MPVVPEGNDFMKKRTKIELVIFAIVAVMFVLGLIRDMPSGQVPEPATTIAAVIEAPSSEAVVETSAQGGSDFIAVETMQHNGTEDSDGEETSEPAPSETAGTTADISDTEPVEPEPQAEIEVREDGEYTDKEHVALYIHAYGHLPSNYITKDEARDAGWDSSKGNLDEVCPGKSIGGDRFGNYEELLPKKKGRKYTECDIDYNPKKGSRGAKRIVFSNDGLIYYTGDHYNTFELLYGEP